MSNSHEKQSAPSHSQSAKSAVSYEAQNRQPILMGLQPVCEEPPRSSELILKFYLPQQREEAMAAMNGLGYRAALSDVGEYLRQKLKYGHNYASIEEALEDVRQYLYSVWDDE